MSYGKAIRLQKHRGNRPRVSKMAQKKSFKSIKTKTSYNHNWNTELMTSQVPIIIVTDPEGQHWEPMIYQPEPKKKLYLMPGLYHELALPTCEELYIIATMPYTQHCLHFSDLSNERYRLCSNSDLMTQPQHRLEQISLYRLFLKDHKRQLITVNKSPNIYRESPDKCPSAPLKHTSSLQRNTHCP